MLIAIGIDWDGRRQILGVELANRESRSSWNDFLRGLKARGLNGVELVVSDDMRDLGRPFAKSCFKPCSRCF
jgi:putative transposase